MTAPLRTPPGRFCLGIDTGGTFTDAVVYDHDTDRVVAAAKTPTRHEDLYDCVVEAMTSVLAGGRGASADAVRAADIGLVAVSTTLATNALVEGAGRPAALVAIGFEAETLARVGLRTGTGATPGVQDSTSPADGGLDRVTGSLVSAPVVIVGGGHGAHGDERDPLDLDELARELDRIDTSVEAYAVAAQFSVRNAAHELQAREAIRERTGKPVTCSHELSPRLGGPRRAVTTLLNAQLISITARFTGAIRAAMESLQLDARLMVVRGDGSLVSADFVTQRPIETVLSGPAASVIGARHLARSSMAGQETLVAGGLVVDIGGTTTDIAAIREGAVVAADGSDDGDTATVGGHATMVTALPTLTVGLGGDSEIRIPVDGSRGELAVGPRRVVPLCVAAQRHPDVVLPMLQRQLEAERPLAEFGQVLLRAAAGASSAHDSGGTVQNSLDSEIMRLVDGADGALPLENLKRSARWRGALERLERSGRVRRAALTPTDACAVLGLFDAEATVNAAAARAAAELFSRQRDRYGVDVGSDAADLSRQVMNLVLRSATEALLSVALGADGIAPGETRRQLAQTALDRRHRELERAVADEPGDTHGERRVNPLWGLLESSGSASVPIAEDAAATPPDHAPLARVDAGVGVPIVAIGAPAPTYAPLVGALLGTEAIVPAHAEVANAVGAAVARVRITKQITVTAPRRGSYRAHWGDDPPVWHSLDEAREWATAQASAAARAEAAAAGARDAAVTVDWETRTAPSNGRELFVEATLRVTATGRPLQQ
ncbi:hydantoinase/oxoprolinase N-terminal domain-containing protein [Candidatus Poriferisodalis sp.]|uniref:hydantoinase/oxoprolinase N-terminal domain-containing protein n=1 Tax=Candidatus Poriferisodalis sp. TaxID=3101277 RepID=UPI003B02D5F6